MKIAAGMIFYDDLSSLKRLMPTLHVDVIYAIDGRFRGFNSPNPLSTDGSREYLKSFENVVLVDAPDLSEVEKRNIYLRLCSEEFLLVVDSDVWFEGSWTEFRNEINEKVNEKNGYGYWILTKDLSRKTTEYIVVGFHMPTKINYVHRHDWYEAEGERILPYSHGGKYTQLKSLTMFNDKSLRTNERRTVGDKWYESSREMELGYHRSQVGILTNYRKRLARKAVIFFQKFRKSRY